MKVQQLFGFRISYLSFAVGAAAFLLAACRINHGLVNSTLPAGPGLTLDESFNIQQGVFLVDALQQHGPLFFTPTVARQVFGAPIYLTDHPPLGRLLLGFSHESTDLLIPGAELSPYNVPAARLGACFALSMLLCLLTEFTKRHYGTATALYSATGLLVMPQMIGHARLATLETVTVLMWFGALLPLLTWWRSEKSPSNWSAVVSGTMWGLLMLTKMQGILFPPLVLMWAVYRLRLKAIRPLLIFGICGSLVFFVAWPWLWLDPLTNVENYLSRASERQALYVWYFGKRFADTDVPWHYPFVTALITVPAVVLAGLVLRLVQRKLDEAEQLLLAALLWPLIVFAVPGVPVYDGSRLFLCIMPPAAILAGRGVALAAERCRTAWKNRASATVRHVLRADGLIMAALLAVAVLLGKTLADGAILSPFAISEYSDLIGGSRGAERLGMEASFWADGLNGDFWMQVPEDSVVLVAPVSHQFQLPEIESLVPIIRARRIQLEAFEYDPQSQKGLLLLLHRLADLRTSLQHIPEGAKLIAEVRFNSVVLARLIDTTHAMWTETP